MLAAISTILSAVPFLRFPHADGHLGFWGTLGINLLAQFVTLPTAVAVAEIRIFACFPAELLDQGTEVVRTWIIEARLPISPQNLWRIPYRDAVGLKREVRRLSIDLFGSGSASDRLGCRKPVIGAEFQN